MNKAREKDDLIPSSDLADDNDARPLSMSAASIRTPWAIISLCRPRQWSKNVFVLAPLVFGGRLTDPYALRGAAMALACFCLLSSAIYCINDVVDARADRRHPRKRLRPIAARRLSPVIGLAVAAILTIASATMSGLTIPAVMPLMGLYLANSLTYVFVLKHKVLIDVLSIAAGFVIRLLAGCAAIQVIPSSWMLVCGFSLALFLGFGKRRLEIDQVLSTSFRPSLQSYDAPKLNTLLGITAAMCLISYMLFTIAPETVELHRTHHLIYTVPLVAYGVFRYLFKVQESQHDGPIEVFLEDSIFVITGFLWLLACLAILNLRQFVAF